MRGGFLVTRGLTSYHQPCHNRLSYARLTGFLHNWDRCQPNPQDMRQMGYDLCISLFPPAHTHTQLMAQRAKSPAALPPPLPLWWTVSDSATNPKELETHPTTHQAACQSPQQFDLTSQFLFISTQLFPRFSLAPTKLRTHFHKNYPTIAWLGVQPWT